MATTVSIVINTLNRASTIGKTLESLPYLDHPQFEVIVVNGPSTDNTDEVIAPYRDAIKYGRCAEANLSISRNVGIAMAEGDIVAFIDDDAVPEPEWLSRIAAAYDSDDIGGVGGFVYDYTGYEFQSRYILCDRVGNAVFGCEKNPTPLYNFPYSREYCSLMGTNATYRRSVLLEIGGFDEYFAYFLDETDVCLRVVDRGYKIVFIDDAYVHHKFAASHLRDTRRVLKDRTQIAKSKGYFTIRNSAETLTYCEAHEALRGWLETVHNGIRWEQEHNFITEHDKWTFFHQVKHGIQEGMEEAFSCPRRLLTEERRRGLAAPFKPFPLKKPSGRRLTVCYLSQDYPPGAYGGIGKWTNELAVELAARGHYIHVITRGEGHNRVDFEDGVWVHRIVPELAAVPGLAYDLPPNIAGYAATVHKEVRRIAAHHPVDIVSAPIWDLEGVCCLLDNALTTVLTLHTTFKLMLESHPEWNNDANHRRNYIDKMIAAEGRLLRQAPYIQANSRAMVQSIAEAYGVSLGADTMGIAYHGIEDRAGALPAERDDDEVRILFVGRLEKRKGIDILLRCVPGLCAQHPRVRFLFVGEDNLKNEKGRTYKEDFLAEHPELAAAGRTMFAGRVSDDELLRHYAECDVFVSPSTFESFGLIFIEAMMFGKPVVGCKAGGMVEVISDEDNGLLCEPGNWLSLYAALERLIADSALRQAFGRRSRQIFLECFTSEKMGDQVLNYYGRVLEQQEEMRAAARHRQPAVSFGS